MNIFLCLDSVDDDFQHNLSHALLKDGVVFNTMELIGWLELYFELHQSPCDEYISSDPFYPANEYSTATENYFKQHPDNELSMYYSDTEKIRLGAVLWWKSLLTYREEYLKICNGEDYILRLTADVLGLKVNLKDDALKEFYRTAFHGLLKTVIGIDEIFSEKKKLNFETRLSLVNSRVSTFGLRKDLSKVVIYLPCDLDSLDRDVKKLLTNLRDLYGVYLMRVELPSTSCFNLANVREQIAASQEISDVPDINVTKYLAINDTTSDDECKNVKTRKPEHVFINKIIETVEGLFNPPSKRVSNLLKEMHNNCSSHCGWKNYQLCKQGYTYIKSLPDTVRWLYKSPTEKASLLLEMLDLISEMNMPRFSIEVREYVRSLCPDDEKNLKYLEKLKDYVNPSLRRYDYCKKYDIKELFDSVERTPEWENVIDRVLEECSKRFKDERRYLGFCHSYWSFKGSVLYKYGINWRDPSEMNPDIKYD